MKVRPLKSGDIPLLKAWAAASGFPYPDFDDPHVEASLVIADSDDVPILEIEAKRLIELYARFDPKSSATLKMKALGMAHEGMAQMLRDKGYNSCECFIPPPIEKSFGNRLMRGIRSRGFLWKWAKNWQSFTIRF